MSSTDFTMNLTVDDEEYELEVEFEIADRDPDVGIMSEYAEDVSVTTVTRLKDEKDIDPTIFWSALSSDQMNIIHEAANTAASNYEPDYD